MLIGTANKGRYVLDYPLTQWAFVCVVAGAVVGLLLNIPMMTQDQGYLPAHVAAAGLTRADPAAVGRPLAAVVHHGTALVAALLYGAVVAGLSSVLPTAVSLNGVPLLPHIIGVAGVTAFIYYFFARIAMPRFGGSVRDDADEIIRQWALTAFIFGTALALFVPVLVTWL
ncbi:hypothetical protein HISP_03395 [Haloarcula hispanica N601]|uniref:Uncharacterized protein n=3 Tax=Haloarcula hispanica TaxID=51589 RepID=A0A482TAS7_HALHI|nr:MULTISPECIES: hypothetical protein [Haloarcula]AEM56282.1 conserved hypothetical protein [Haloarcula hispanica ATCC 33960]AHB65093.1 hypothetical protein HISP_03395 [Haloarcula hispanica N601]KAA9407939.1 hypothetical protein Har1131_14365 [Haloarcula sp. CBA1131]KAA9409015.1 hypothetical protein EGO51_04150 [Haloarcula hispanica]KZX47962.1 hypothetical protein AV929_09640 [Haloarcula sp. K1]